MSSEWAVSWRLPEQPGTDLLAARYRTHAYTRHTHDGYALGVLLEGAEGFTYRRGSHVAAAGDVVLVMPGEVHDGYGADASGWAYRMMYPPIQLVVDVARELGHLVPAGTYPVFAEAIVQDPVAAATVTAAHRALQGCADRLTRDTALRVALGALLRRHSSGNRSSTAVPLRADLRRVFDRLHDDPVHAPDLAGLSALANLSSFHLLRSFRDATGLPPHAYLTQLRVRRAQRLLTDGVPGVLGRPGVADVACAVGFADASHLSRHFTRIVGVPPAAWRDGWQRGGSQRDGFQGSDRARTSTP